MKKAKSNRPRGKVAQQWYDNCLALRRINESLVADAEQARRDVERIDKMYQALDAKYAAIRRALSVIASFDANRWSAHFRGYELQKP